MVSVRCLASQHGMAWVSTLPCAAILAALAYWLIELL